jgi:activator of HSP90 ATPase
MTGVALKTTIEFRGQAVQDLEELAEILSTSRAEVIRTAISILAEFMRHRQIDHGRELAIVNEAANSIVTIFHVPGAPARSMFSMEREARTDGPRTNRSTASVAEQSPTAAETELKPVKLESQYVSVKSRGAPP